MRSVAPGWSWASPTTTGSARCTTSLQIERLSGVSRTLGASSGSVTAQNHWRWSSMSETRTVGAPSARAATRVSRSRPTSGPAPTRPVARSTASRAGSRSVSSRPLPCGRETEVLTLTVVGPPARFPVRDGSAPGRGFPGGCRQARRLSA